MRRIISALSIVALGGAALVGWTSSASGQQEGEFASFEVIKDVHGDGPSSGYVVEWSCVNDQQFEFASGTLFFDNIVAGHESQEVFIGEPGTCTIEETDANGADLVEYECEFFPGPDNSSTEGTPAGCLGDRSAHFTRSGDFGSFLVRNTFDPDVGPGGDVKPGPYHQPTSPAGPAVVTPGGVVAASPAFTG